MLFEELSKNVIKYEKQGFALYYYHNGKTLEKVSGVLDSEDSDKITFNSMFRLASVSKQFIAFGIVRLIREKKLNFETKVREVFENLPSYFDDITIKHLLNHTSGIFDYEDMPHCEDDPQIKDEDILTFLNTTSSTYFIPGSTYRYSNTAYILLGLIIEKISKVKLGEYLDGIFKEAKMNKTVANYEGITEIPSRAYGHLMVDQKMIVQDQYWCSATLGDGGIYSCINDLKKWCLFLSNSEEFKLMKIPNYISEVDYNEYGMGLRIIKVIDKEIVFHTGDTIGTNTLLLFSEDFKMCLIFLTNVGDIDTMIMKDNLVYLIERGFHEKN